MMRYDSEMRTTLDIGDDVLAAARQLAQDERRTIGDVLTDLSRLGLKQRHAGFAVRNGMPVLPRRSDVVVTLEMVNAWRDEEP